MTGPAPPGSAVSRVLPWSYSSLQQYETCPRRVKIIKIDRRLKEPMTESMIWGNDVHQAMEYAVKGTNALAPRFIAYAPIVAKLRGFKGLIETERNFGLTANFAPTSYWAPDAWVRGKIDVSLTSLTTKTATIFDYKTGKPKPDVDQLNLFAAALLSEKPYLQRVHTGYIWLAHNKIDSETVEREHVPMIWQGFVQRVARMVHSAEKDDWPPRPSGLCKDYCPVGRANCEFCGKP